MPSVLTRTAPMPPMLTMYDAPPGPPFQQNVTGRSDLSEASETCESMNMWPMSVPSSSRTGTISAVAV